MIYSMTGYGKGTAGDQDLMVITEIKSTNHRFLDLKIHLNREYSFLENVLRQQIAPQVKRGHVDLTLSITRTSVDSYQVIYNRDLAIKLQNALEELKNDCLLAQDLSLEPLLKTLNVFEVERKGFAATQSLSLLAKKSLDQALKSLISMRAEEGKEISKQLKIHLDNIQKYLSRLIELLPEEAKEYRRRLESRIIGMLGEKITIDEYRLIHEIAILAEKADVTEETARLKSHLRQLTQWLQLKKEKGIGKKLDFILQEINREINTIGSKSNHLDIARLVIELKNETEMIREQVQNIE